MDMYIIYTIQGQDKLYVGSSRKGFAHRRNRHLGELRANRHGNFKLQEFFNEHGEKSLAFTQIHIVENPEDLLKWEQYYMDTLLPWFNICPIAGNTTGRFHTEESREKLRIARRKRPPMSSETKEKIRQGMLGKNAGKKASPETKEKLRISHLGNKHTKEQKEKMSLSRMGRTVSEKTRIKISLSNKGKHSNPLTEEHKKRISKANMGRVVNAHTREKIGNGNRGKVRSNEFKELLRVSATGRIASEETRKKLSEKSRGRKMPPRTKEHIDKWIKSRKENKLKRELEARQL